VQQVLERPESVLDVAGTGDLRLEVGDLPLQISVVSLQRGQVCETGEEVPDRRLPDSRA
jgi:hypothetical protein